MIFSLQCVQNRQRPKPLQTLFLKDDLFSAHAPYRASKMRWRSARAPHQRRRPVGLAALARRNPFPMNHSSNVADTSHTRLRSTSCRPQRPIAAQSKREAFRKRDRASATFGRPVRSQPEGRTARGHINGGANRDRTDDPLLAKQVLSQLSYSPEHRRCPGTAWWARVDSNYRPHAYQACALTT